MTSPTQLPPRVEYVSRLDARRKESDRLWRSYVRVGNLRLAVAVVFALIVWGSVRGRILTPWWLVVPVAAFVMLVVRSERLLRERACADRAAEFYEKGIDRLSDRWVGAGEPGSRFRDPSHPYADDLDLFGKGSLFELLSTARTPMGEDKLAAWLLSPAPPEAVRERQAAVSELRDRLDLRENLSVLEEDVRAGVHPEALLAWAEERPLLVSRVWRIAAAALAVLVAGSAVAWGWTGMIAPLAAALTLTAGFGFWLRPQVLHVVHGVEHAVPDLMLVSQVLSQLEGEHVQSAYLVRLRAALETHGLPPSRSIARLNRLLELIDSRDSLVMRILGPPLLYTTQLAFAVEAWRRDCGSLVRRWLEAMGEMEALSALAGYAYEHPSDPFPEFSEEQTWLDGEGLAHPLLPGARSVRNDLRLGSDLRVLIVSGSNMSGKSTLLRTVGINVVMAMAGAPVRARRLTLAPLAVGASIRVTDSLQDGSSRFYAEITRLRKIVDLAAGPFPLLFLLDELLNGTNSHDRRIGAEAVVRGLVERGAIGLVTTHDLALAHIADTLAPRGTNVHFEDHIENGEMTFDYRLRPGIVQKSNALELMRSIGLDV